MSNSEGKTPVLFPHFDNAETAKTFKRDTVALATAMTTAAMEYLGKLNDKPELHPHAQSVGAACYLTSHLLALNMGDDGKAQVAQGLVAMLLTNDDDMSSLVNLPTDGMKPS